MLDPTPDTCQIDELTANVELETSHPWSPPVPPPPPVVGSESIS